MQKLTVIAAPAIRAYGYRRAIAGLMIGALLGYLASLPAAAVVDERMERACGYPRYPGESLMIGIDEKGITRCWKGPTK